MDALDIVRRWHTAAAEYDGAKAWSCFAPGGSYQDHRHASPISGEDLRRFCDQDMEAMKGVSDLAYDFTYVSMVDATHAVAEFSVRGQAGKHPMNFRGAEMYEFDPVTGLIAALRGYGNFVK